MVPLEMKQNVVYKVPGGKLLRISLEVENNTIRDIQITGDFFIHPESGILLIEKALKGADKGQVRKKLNEVVGSSGIKIIGFTPDDLEKAISDVNG
jgi:lipoate---protein ligase